MKKLTFIIIALALASLAQAQTVTQVYHFDNPVVSEREGYQQIGLKGCLPAGQVGEPTLPWQSVSLILPQGQEAVSMQVAFSDFVEMEGTYNLYPYQKPRPYSSEERIPFAKNETLYRSNTAYPAEAFGTVSTQYLNGVAFAFGGFTPVRYLPATGKVSYARTVTVSINTAASRDDRSGKLWMTPENEASIKRLAQNESMLSTYHHRGREVNGYDMLVITAEEWIPRFGEYLDLYNGKGVRTRIVALEEIYATMTGRDEQEQIRNYIIQEYENNGISMVSLGGDVGIVPFRYLWCFAQEGYEDQLPSDMYYACLDGTLNDDGDDRWGEVGEDDLLPELGIGRLPFNNETQFNIVMGKTLSYLLNPVLGEFTSPILGAEHLGDGYYGSDDMERLIGTSTDYGYTTHGYPTDYNFKKYYASPTFSFNGGGFKRVIGTGGQYVHHVGHANTGIVAGWDINYMGDNYFPNNDGVNHNYMLFHSHGCICGDFSHSCILERMVTIPTGFVVTSGNSRYGWYVPWGDGMAAHIHREMVDAYCHDQIASVGMAIREAKIASAPWVTLYGEEGCLRWNIYCLNVLGDGALCPWFEEPFNPNVVYEQGIVTGTPSTTVHVTHLEEPLSNFRVSLFDGDALLATALTNANGDATLTFDPALESVGELQLIVTGQSAWPQVLEMECIESGVPYVYGDLIGFEGEALSGSQSLGMSGDLYNKGNVAAYNVQVAVSTDSEYLTLHDNSITIDELGANATLHDDHLASIDIADNVPDMTLFTLDLTTNVGDVAHTTRKTFTALAPNLQFADIVVDDSEGDGNGFIDPGERITLHVNGRNAGHALAHDAALTVSCDDERLHFDEVRVTLGNIEVQGNFTADIVFTTDYDVPSGTTFFVDMEFLTGAYATPYQYVFADGQLIETFESGDFSFLEWEHGGDLPWFVTDDDAHSGNHSARSGAVDKHYSSQLLVYTDILLDGEISFWFKTSTRYERNFFCFLIDNELMGLWSGENDWTPVSFSFNAGSHVFQWIYEKNHASQDDQDCIWIDDVVFPRTCMVTGVETVVGQGSNHVYPNPCQGSFTLNLVEESTVDIYNLLGQQVMHLEKMEGKKELALESGLYFIRISNASGVETLKLVCE